MKHEWKGRRVGSYPVPPGLLSRSVAAGGGCIGDVFLGCYVKTVQ